MFELMLAVLAPAIFVVAVLVYIEAIDLFDLIAAVVKLAAGLLFAVGAFFVWLVRRGCQEKRP
jgi:hypothetical protein